MKLEDKMSIANEVIDDFIWWHKSVGLKGLAESSKVKYSLLESIQNKDCSVLSATNYNAIKKGIENIKEKTIIALDAILFKLEGQKDD